MSDLHTNHLSASANTLPLCQGLLFILVGPAGVGKNSIMHGVLDTFSTVRQMPTATTRAIRSTEQQGREHWFVTPETFQQMIANRDLIEYEEVYPGKFYGTPRQQIEEALHRDHQLLIADIDYVGASKLKEALTESVILIFVQPPTLEVLNERLHMRGQMSEQEIATRLARAPIELEFAARCEYRVTNTLLADAIQQVIGIIKGEAERHGCV